MLWLFLISVALAFLLTQIAAIATTVYLHRALTHKCFKLKNPSAMIFRMICWFMTGTVPRNWVAVHRKHHAYTDTEGDPHSPKLEGFWKVQLLNTVYYIKESRKIDVEHWARGVPDYGWLDRHDFLGLTCGILLAIPTMGLIALGFGENFWWGVPFGLLTAVLHLLFFIFANALINAFCHMFGYKTYSDADAFNVRWIATLTAGEGMHNNHHKHQQSPRLRTGARKGETDLGWLVIKILDRCGQIHSKSELWPATK